MNIDSLKHFSPDQALRFVLSVFNLNHLTTVNRRQKSPKTDIMPTVTMIIEKNIADLHFFLMAK